MRQIFLLGTNPRLESPLLNVRLRKAFLKQFDFRAYSLVFL